MKRLALFFAAACIAFFQNAHAHSGPVEAIVDSVRVVSCYGEADGGVFITVVGGTEPFTFEWSNGEVSEDIENLPAGLYSCLITDGDGDQFFLQDVDVSESLPLYVDIPVANGPDCMGSGGYIIAAPVDGTPPYTFLWNTGADTDFLEGVPDGDYYVTVTDGNGCTAENSIYIETIYPYAEAGDEQILLCTNSTGTLDGSQSSQFGDYAYHWAASDGGAILADTFTLAPTIRGAGRYLLTVTDTLTGCLAVDSVFVYGENFPPEAALMGGTLTCAATSAQLTADFEPLDRVFFWQNPAGDTLFEASPTVGTGGAYWFALTDTMTTCSAQFSTSVGYDTLAPTVAASVADTVTCAQTSTQITTDVGAQSLDFQWIGPNGYASNAQNPFVNYGGEYLLSAINPDNGCATPATVFVMENTAPPVAAIAPPGILTCVVNLVTLDASASSQGAGIVYMWSENGVPLPPITVPTFDVVAPALYFLTVFDSGNGCTASAAALVLADTDAPSLSATGGLLTCAAPETQILAISDAPDAAFAWSGPGSFSANEAAPTVSQPGTYSVTATDQSSGCTASASAVVLQNIAPPDLASSNQVITCAQPEATLTVTSDTPGATFTWWSGTALIEVGPTFSTAFPGTYGIIATNPENGCTASIYPVVTVDNQAPTADAGDDATLNCFNASALLGGSGSSQGAAFSYQWMTADGQISAGENTPNATASSAGTYTLLVTNTQNGCTSSDAATVEQTPTLAVYLVDSAMPLCHGGADGWASVGIDGGTGNVIFEWSNGAQTPDVFDLAAGNYTVTATDVDGCTATLTASIGQPSALVLTLSATAETAADLNDGTASAMALGGTAPYDFYWDTGELSENIGPLAPGVYTATVVDANGCTAEQTTNVNEFGCNLAGSIAATHLACADDQSGAADLQVSGANGSLNFLWSNGATAQNLTGLGGGNYAVTATDDAGCALVLSVQITEPQVLIINLLSQTNVLCLSDQTGALAALASGGIPPYDFAWSNGSAQAANILLSVGDYDLTVTDANGCETNLSAIIEATDVEPPTLILHDLTLALDENGEVYVSPENFDNGSSDNACGIETWDIFPATQFTCADLGEHLVTLLATDENGNSASGTALLTIVDDLAPTLHCPQSLTTGECAPTVAFDLPEIEDNCASDPADLVQIEGLPSGADFPLGTTTQIFELTDAAGNTGNCTFFVTVEPLPAVQILTASTSCSGVCDGSASIDALVGSNANWEAYWSNGEIGIEIGGLCPGTYTATVVDVNGCTQVVDASVSEPEPLVATAEVSQNPNCPDDLTGAVTATASGGTAPYTFQWSNGAPTLENVPAGTYAVTATDARGCRSVASLVLQSIDNEPPTVIAQDITVSLNALGQAVISPNQLDAGSADNCGIATLDVSQFRFNCAELGANVVTLTATDAAGNETSQTAIVTVVDEQKPLLSCPGNVAVSYCHAMVEYPRPVAQDNCDPVPSNLQQLEGLPSGSIFPTGLTINTFAYTDGGGNADTCSFSVRVSEPMTVAASVTNVSCFGACDGQVSLAATGGVPPYSYVWMGDPTQLCAGTYAITVVDAQGCSETLAFTITQPPAILATTSVSHDHDDAGTGSINLTASGGAGAYTFHWSNGATTPNLANLYAGFYTCTITDANGCTAIVGPIEVKNIVGTEEAAWAVGLQIQPNPARDATQFLLKNSLGQAAEIWASDALGRAVRLGQISPADTRCALDVSALAAGSWLLQIRAADGSRATRKLLIVR